MSTASIVLLVIGILALIESLFCLSSPKLALKIGKKMGFGKLCKNEKRVKKVVTWELIAAIILIIIAINI